MILMAASQPQMQLTSKCPQKLRWLSTRDIRSSPDTARRSDIITQVGISVNKILRKFRLHSYSHIRRGSFNTKKFGRGGHHLQIQYLRDDGCYSRSLTGHVLIFSLVIDTHHSGLVLISMRSRML